MRAFLRVLLASVVTLAVACSQPAAELPDETQPAERIAAIRDARQVVGGPVAELTAATANAVSAVALLREELPAEPERRISLAEKLAGADLVALDEAIATATEARDDLRGQDASPVADVAAAADAMDAAISAAEETRRTAALELARVRRIAEVDQQLDTMVDAWDEGGARSTLLTRYAELAEQARTLASELESPISDADTGLVDQRDCDGARDRRQQAATAVAEASAELRQLVSSRRGNELDDRIEELVADPYGTGETLVELDRQQASCWADGGPVAAARDRLAEALDRLESALNPSDLSEAPTPAG